MSSKEQVKVGDHVRTVGDTRFVSTGVVVTLSPCGRYAKVQKNYGSRCQWTKDYPVSALKPFVPTLTAPRPGPGAADEGRGMKWKP